MSFSKISVISALALATSVAAHGTVSGLQIGSTYYEGYSPSMQYESVAPIVVGWAIPEDQDNGYVPPTSYADSDIICHKNASNAMTYATVAAGGTIDVEWTTWPSSHKGPVIDYLASCNGDCTTVDKTTLEWVKIDEAGLVSGTMNTGTWASDDLIANNNTWTVTIPSILAAGDYVLRNEIIALHSAGSVDGAQNYPQCVNLKVTGSGTTAISGGVLATTFYTETDAGIEVNIYTDTSTYDIPGPALWSEAASSNSTSGASSGSPATVVAASATTSAAPVATSVNVAVVATATATPTKSASSATTSSASASSSSTAVLAMPEGTTMTDLLTWLSTMISSILDGTTSVTRRSHARDVTKASHQ